MIWKLIIIAIILMSLIMLGLFFKYIFTKKAEHGCGSGCACSQYQHKQLEEHKDGCGCENKFRHTIDSN